jgi:exopolyphosphatase / guanosine-5'-triphosphate,3'-diphosphate pyrophosphatase
MARQKIPEIIAAVDLGSNSFHMVVARYSHGQLLIVDRLREPVRLASGLDEQGRLHREVTDRALAALERFGQRLRDVRAEGVRVVGTNTLRRAKRAASFVERAQAALGHPIEVISGIEEARLIYVGALHSMPSEPGKRLLVDIGGGSTELIIGEGRNTRMLESLQMGCVVMSQRFFDDGVLTEKRFKKARLAARVELEPIAHAFRQLGWDNALGSSGTIRSAFEIAKGLFGLESPLTPSNVEQMIEHCIRVGHVDKLKWPELTPDRTTIFPGGIAILAEVLATLEVKSMGLADGALREGLLYDLVGRFTDEDARVRSVRAMEGRFHVDAAQATRVEQTALQFLSQVSQTWQLESPMTESLLGWAARLHEIGLDVSHAHYHRHGGYLLEHADMPGFPRDEQRVLAALVSGHRRRLDLKQFDDLPAPWVTQAEYLVVLLRLAVLLHRSRSPMVIPTIQLKVRGRTITLEFPRNWLDEHPLTQTDIEQEAEFLRGVGFRLRVD